MPIEHSIHFDHIALSEALTSGYMIPDAIGLNELYVETTINEVDLTFMGGVCCNGSCVPEYRTLDVVITPVVAAGARQGNYVY